jgi:hypothetical protein
MGRSHEKSSIPCQDKTGKSKGREVHVIALADGAGSARFSEYGAEIAVQIIMKLLRAEFTSLLDVGGEVCAERIIHQLQASLNQCADKKNISFHELASTLLFFATDGADYLCGQVGDGRISRFNNDLSVAELIFEPDKGEYFNETTFLTSSQAFAALQLEWGNTSDIGAIALMSDGAEESLFNRHDKTFAPALGKMAGWLDLYTEKKVQEALANNLYSTLRQKTMDDLSIALLRFIDM